MPKQRNHPHHHAHSERHEDGELELPQARFSPLGGGRRYIYPKGWVTKPAPFVAGRLYLLALGFAGAILLLAVVFSLLFGGH